MSLVYKLKNGSLLDEISKVQGTLTAGTSRGYVNHDKGLALELTGDTVLTVADRADLSFGDGTTDSAFSISVWVYMRDATSFMIVTKGVANTDAEWRFQTNASDKLVFLLYDESVADCYIGRTYNTTLTAYENQWVHVKATYSGSGTDAGIKLYLNNDRVDDTDLDSNPGSYVAMENLTHDVWIGRYDSIYSNGMIKNVEINLGEYTAKERGQLYTEFLQAGQTNTAIRGFSFPKDTDLSDEVEDTIGSEQVDNPSFTTNVTSWTKAANDETSTMTHNAADEALNLAVTNAGTNGLRPSITGTLSPQFVSGKKYRVRIVYRVNSGTCVLARYYSGAGTVQLNKTFSGANVYEFEFVAAGASNLILYFNGTATFDVDMFNISVQELTGLVAAYNMTLVGNQVMDLSGNGNHGTNSGAMSTEDGLVFDGVDDYVAVADNFSTYDNFTISCRIKARAFTTDYGRILSFTVPRIGIRTTGILSVRFEGADVEGVQALQAGQSYSLTFTYKKDGNLNSYINGVLDKSTAVTSTLAPGALDIGRHTGANLYFDGEISDVKIYNVAKDAQFAKDYHNSFNRPYIVENFDYGADGVTKLPPNWIAGTGTYSIEEMTAQDSVLTELDVGKRFMKCQTAGTIAIPSKWAYGEMKVAIYKGGAGNYSRFLFINTTTDAAGGGGNSYNINLDATEYLSLRKDASNIFATAASYIAINTWYQIKIQRGSGVFKEIPTLQTSDLVNYPTPPNRYTTFTANGASGFTAISDGSDTHVAGTADEISVVSGVKYLVEFDLDLVSGTAPTHNISQTLISGGLSTAQLAVNGKNSHVFTVSASTTGVIGFYNLSTASNYTISNLTIRRIYDEGTFLTLIRGGAFGTGWTVVSVVGGSGTNPVTDNTYTTSNFIVADLDADDCIADAEFFTQFDV